MGEGTSKSPNISLIIGPRGLEWENNGNCSLQIFCKCQIWPLTPASRSCRVIMQKGPSISIIIGSKVSKYENNL